MCQSCIAITEGKAMLLPTALLLGSVHPAFLLKVKDRDLMEGTLQKYVEDFMAYYGNSTGVSHSKAPQRIKTVLNWGKNNQNNATRGEKVNLSSVHGNRSKKEFFKNRQKKRKVQKRQRKTRPKSQNKGNAYYTQPHGHAYEFDGAFDPFPLWEYSGL